MNQRVGPIGQLRGVVVDIPQRNDRWCVPGAVCVDLRIKQSKKKTRKKRKQKKEKSGVSLVQQSPSYCIPSVVILSTSVLYVFSAFISLFHHHHQLLFVLLRLLRLLFVSLIKHRLLGVLLEVQVVLADEQLAIARPVGRHHDAHKRVLELLARLQPALHLCRSASGRQVVQRVLLQHERHVHLEHGPAHWARVADVVAPGAQPVRALARPPVHGALCHA